ncbi:MAG: DMT family transporter [Planctomycetota bacterium]
MTPALRNPRLTLIVAYACLALGAPLTKWLGEAGGSAMAAKFAMESPTVEPPAPTAMTKRAGDAGPKISFCNFLFVGNLCAGLVVLAVFGPRRIAGELAGADRRSLALLLVAAAPAIAVPALMFAGLQGTTAINAVLLSRLGALGYGLVGSLVGRRPLATGEWAGMALTAVGVVVLAIGDNGFRLNFGDGLVIAAAVVYSAAALLARATVNQTSAPSFVFVRNALSAAVFFVIAIAAYGPGHFADAFSSGVWAPMAVYAAVAIVAGQVALYSAVARAEPAQVAGWSVLSPVLALVYAFVLLGERPDAGHAVSLALVAAGIMLPSRFARWQASWQRAAANGSSLTTP